MSTGTWIFLVALAILAYQFYVYQKSSLIPLEVVILELNQEKKADDAEMFVSQFLVEFQNGYLSRRRKKFVAHITTIAPITEQQIKTTLSLTTKKQWNDAHRSELKKIKEQASVGIPVWNNTTVYLSYRTGISNRSPRMDQGEFQISFDSSGVEVYDAIGQILRR